MTAPTSKPVADTELATIQENFVHYMCDVCQFPVFKATGVANLLCGAKGSPLSYTPVSTKPECVICVYTARTGCPVCGTKLGD